MDTSFRLAMLLAFQAPAICLIICTYVFCSLKRNGLTRKQFILLRVLAVGCIFAMACEVVSGIILYEVFEWDIRYITVFNNLGYLAQFVNTFALGEFCISRINRPSRLLSVLVRVFYTAAGIMVLARVFIPDTTLFTYFGSAGEILYGPLDDVQTWCCAVSVLMLSGLTFVKVIDKNEYIDRERYVKLLIAALLVATALLLYVTLYVPYVVGVANLLVVLYLFINLQRLMVYSDELTSLPNRRRMLLDIREKERTGDDWGYLLADVNSFKQVNDQHGHNEGDRALTVIASVLDRAAKKNDSKAYRVGGDEFALLLSSDDGERAQEICEEIDRLLSEWNAKSILPYTLSTSLGYAFIGENDARDVQAIIQLADERMYEDKRRRKAAG